MGCIFPILSALYHAMRTRALFDDTPFHDRRLNEMAATLPKREKWVSLARTLMHVVFSIVCVHAVITWND